MHAARELSASVEPLDARPGIAVNANASICGVCVHGDSQLVGGRDVEALLHPGGEGLHEFRDIIAGEEETDGHAGWSRRIDCAVDALVVESAGKRPVA